MNKIVNIKDLKGLKVVVMGLGLNGGGFAATEFLAKAGANLIVTDLRDEKILAPTLKKLSKFDNIKYRLGEHLLSDFENADFVIKNPAVKADSPFLKASKWIESDISLFLRLTKNPILAVTGSKGKSTTVSALHKMLQTKDIKTFLGGNITVSPLSFFSKADKNPKTAVILELSSWQLADLNRIEKQQKEIILKPKIALITNIMHDHQNAYNDFQDYVDDKKFIFKNQNKDDILIIQSDKWGKEFKKEAKSNCFVISSMKDLKNQIFLNEDLSGWINIEGKKSQILPREITLRGNHNRLNLLQAASIARLWGVREEDIQESGSKFSGIAYRMESVATTKIGNCEIEWINDSAATMPDAVVASCSSFNSPVFLIAGGTDKELDFEVLSSLPSIVKRIYLLDGSATDKFSDNLPTRYKKTKTYYNLKSAIDCAIDDITNQTKFEKNVLLLSPGAASFGMFKNEFDRGDQFRAVAESYK